MLPLVVRNIFSRETICYFSVRLHCQESEVGQRIYLRPCKPRGVQPRFRKNVVELQRTLIAEQLVMKFKTVAPVPRVINACKHVQEWIEPRASTPRHKVIRPYPEIPSAKTHFINQTIQPSLRENLQI